MKCYTENYSNMAIGASGRVKLQTISVSGVTPNVKVKHKICNNPQPVLACYTQQSVTVEKYELKTNGLFL